MKWRWCCGLDWAVRPWHLACRCTVKERLQLRLPRCGHRLACASLSNADAATSTICSTLSCAGGGRCGTHVGDESKTVALSGMYQRKVLGGPRQGEAKRVLESSR